MGPVLAAGVINSLPTWRMSNVQHFAVACACVRSACLSSVWPSPAWPGGTCLKLCPFIQLLLLSGVNTQLLCKLLQVFPQLFASYGQRHFRQLTLRVLRVYTCLACVCVLRVCVRVACVCAIKVLHVPPAETCPLAANHRPVSKHTHTHVPHTHAHLLSLSHTHTHAALKAF